MKLSFNKEDKNKYVKIITSENKSVDFDYIEMIGYIFKDKGIEEPEICPNYTKEEVESIKSLISDISETINPLFKESEEVQYESEIVDEDNLELS